MSLKELFPFDYVGGGYFRRRGVPKGINAEMLHGKEAVEYLYRAMTEPKQPVVEDVEDDDDDDEEERLSSCFNEMKKAFFV